MSAINRMEKCWRWLSLGLLCWMGSIQIAVAQPEELPATPEIEAADPINPSPEPTEGPLPSTPPTTPSTEGTEQPSSEAAAPTPEELRLAEARTRSARADSLYDDGNYDAAVVEFLATLELIPGHPMRYRVYFNIAKAYERLFRYADAVAFYERYLAEGGQYEDQAAEVRAQLSVLEDLLGTVTLEVTLQHYEVWIDDRHVGDDVESILIPGGNHTIEVRAVGYTPNQQAVQVPARSERALTFSMLELAEEYEGLHPAFFWTATLITVGAVAGGIVFGVKAMGLHDDAQELADGPSGGLGTVTDADEEAIADAALTADVFFAGALLAGTTAIIFLALTRSGDDEPEDESISMSPALSPNQVGMTLRGAF